MEDLKIPKSEVHEDSFLDEETSDEEDTSDESPPKLVPEEFSEEELNEFVTQYQLSARESQQFIRACASARTFNVSSLLRNITGEEIPAHDARKISLEHLRNLNPVIIEVIRRGFIHLQRLASVEDNPDFFPEYIGGPGKWRDDFLEDWKEGEDPSTDIAHSWRNLSEEELKQRNQISSVEIIQLSISENYNILPLYLNQLQLKINWEKRTFYYEYIDSQPQNQPSTGKKRDAVKHLEHFLFNTLRKKIEFSFDDVNCIRISPFVFDFMRPNPPELTEIRKRELCLEFELRNIPRFYTKKNKIIGSNQNNPWRISEDCTEGAASTFRNHCVFIPNFSLSKTTGPSRNHKILEKLLEREPRFSGLRIPNQQTIFTEAIIPKKKQKHEEKEKRNVK